MKIHMAFIGVGLLLAFSAVWQQTFSTSAASISVDRITLLCMTTVQGRLLTALLDVDYKNKTVNAVSAKISDTSVHWQTPDGNLTVYHELDRLKGIYRNHYGLFATDFPPAYYCKKAPPGNF